MLSKMWSGTQFKSVRSLSLKRFEETIITSSLKMRTYLPDNFPKFFLQIFTLAVMDRSWQIFLVLNQYSY